MSFHGRNSLYPQLVASFPLVLTIELPKEDLPIVVWPLPMLKLIIKIALFAKRKDRNLSSGEIFPGEKVHHVTG